MTVAKLGTDLFGPVCCGISLRSEASNEFEDAMKMIKAQPHITGQRFKIRQLFGVFNVSARIGNQLGMFECQQGLIGSGTFAGSIACGFCRGRGIKKHHIFRMRQACRATGPAIDARRLNSIDKGLVGGRISGLD